MTGRLENKIGIITGGGSGIGLASARLFLNEGAVVIIAGTSDERNQKVAGELNEQHPGKCEYVHCDVRVKEDDEHLINHVFSTYGRCDYYFANAGYAGPTDVEPATYDFEVFDRIFKTNVYGLFYQMTTLLPLMEKQGSGSIILTSSASPFTPCSCPSYSASKGATRAYMMDLANLEAPKGIRINKVVPGVIVTDMTKQITDPSLKGTEFYEYFINMIPAKKFCPPEAVAEAALFFASDASSHCIGAELKVDDGFINQC